MGSKGSRKLSLNGITSGMKLDAYQRSAQLYPAVLTVLAPLVAIFFWLPSEAKLVSSLMSAVASAALIALLMQIGRAKGRAVQARLMTKHGGIESTIGLRHRDTHIAGPSRQRYHAFLASQGLRIPTSAEEIADPVEADEFYRAAADWLRERTREPKKFALLQGENRTYGFRRNLRGMKPIGLTLNVLALAGDVAALWFTATKSLVIRDGKGDLRRADRVIESCMSNRPERVPDREEKQAWHISWYARRTGKIEKGSKSNTWADFWNPTLSASGPSGVVVDRSGPAHPLSSHHNRLALT